MADRNKKRNIAFIPARGGSKSIPLKNIKSFNGRPLLHWVLSAADNCSLINEIIVSTDHMQIKTCALAYGSDKLKVFDRAADTATDEASTESAMIDYIKNDESVTTNDSIILLQATSPWTSSDNIEGAIIQYKDGGFDSLLSVVPSHAFQWNAQGTPLNYDYRRRPRRQNMQKIFQENGAIYINSVENILKDKNRLSGRIGLYEMHKYSALELDESDDWLLAEEMMRIYVG